MSNFLKIVLKYHATKKMPPESVIFLFYFFIYFYFFKDILYTQSTSVEWRSEKFIAHNFIIFYVCLHRSQS